MARRTTDGDECGRSAVGETSVCEPASAGSLAGQEPIWRLAFPERGGSPTTQAMTLA
jgi:hypothetical protein